MKKLNSLIAKVTIFSVVLGLVGFVQPANAAALTSMSATLTRLSTSTTADHTILFTTPTGVAAGETIVLTFESDFSIAASLDFEDIDLSTEAAGGDGVCDTGDTEDTLAAAPSGATWGAVRTSATVITITSGTDTIAAGAEVCIEIGTNAEEGVAGVEQITNPTSAGSHTLTIGGSQTDSGQIGIGITESDTVTINAEVDAFLTFDIDVATADATENNPATNPVDFTGANSLSTAAVGASDNSAVDSIFIDIDTNAQSGFSITGRNSSSTSRDLVSTGTPADTIAAVASDSTTLVAGTEGWGLCIVGTPTASTGTITSDTAYDGDGSNDGCDAGTADVDVTAPPLSSASPDPIATASDVVAGGDIEIAVKAAIAATTEAHDDYTTSIHLIATGTF